MKEWYKAEPKENQT